ncbi:MAG: hypothetical protein CR974_03990 [Gammaproteobacteria bacterium]|nr:MAG: hypothetical protein CR974_03990 [Gammaproteobacteria bacterium]
MQPIALAETIADAYRACNPDYALPADDPRYMDLSSVRGENQIVKEIKRSIEFSDDSKDEYRKFLLSGHRGCGKTTELYQLQNQLEKSHYACVYIEMGESLDLADLSYIDLFLVMVEKTADYLGQRGINIDNGIIEDINNWISQEVYSEKTTAHENSVEAKAGFDASLSIAKLIKIFGSLSGDIKHSESQRTVIRERIEKRSTDFIKKINEFFISVNNKLKEQSKHGLVILADGLDKMHYRSYYDSNDNLSDTYSDLFIRRADKLHAPYCHIVYTVPINLMFTSNLQNNFQQSFIVPMVKLPRGEEVLKQLIGKRINIDAVFANETLVSRLINNSGGVMRDLMRLVRLASIQADEAKISEQDVQYAINQVTREYDRLLKSSDAQILRDVQQCQRTNPDDERTKELLLNRLILEYENGKRTAIIHPICKNIEWVRHIIGE